jgi:LacI family transcriptional regulator
MEKFTVQIEDNRCQPPYKRKLGVRTFGNFEVNIKQLAKTLELSISTVSRALNGYTDVNAQTRLRVQEAAATFGYQADAGARRLVRGSTDAIGMVYASSVDSLGNPQFADMTHGLSKCLETSRMDLLLAVAEDDHEVHIYDRLFKGGRVDAVVVPNTRVQDNRITYLQSKGHPFVAYGRTQSSADYSWVDFDNDHCSELAVEHLWALGHRSFAYVHADLELNYAFERHRGFQRAIATAGLQCPLSHVIGDVIDRRTGAQAVKQLLALPNFPTAIVVDNNLGGVGVLQGLMDAGLKVGHDVSVVVHGDIPVNFLNTGLLVTTVQQPTPRETGADLAALVLKVLSKPQDGPYHILKKSALVVGTTSGPAR